MKKSQPVSRLIASSAIGILSLILAYAPLPGAQKTVVVVSGTELAEPLKKLESKFEEQYPNINLELKFQGSQDLVNNYIDDKNDFKPTVLIPASGQFIEELNQRFSAQNQGEAFYQTPQPIAKTFLVAIAWPERGQVLFPDGRFSWAKIEQAMLARSWQKIGSKNDWGSFDFITTDPTRSNSGQITLSLWIASKSKDLNSPEVESLLQTIKQSVYQPPRSTDILLQEFITRGPNDADVATVYESIALSRWQQSAASQGKPYQIYYINPTQETVATAAIVKRDVSQGEADAALEFINFMSADEQQKVFIEYGFRPVKNNIDLTSVPNSPWSQNIPGVEVNPPISTIPAPNSQQIDEIQRLWQRVN